MKRIIGLVLVICLLASFFVSCKPNEKEADLVVYGTIYTAEKENEGIAEAFAVKDGKYIFVGSKEDAKKYVKDGKTEVIDKTNEGLIIPGCTEGHCHYVGQSGIDSLLPCSNCSYKEMIEVLKEQVKKEEIKQFVSFGFNAIEVAERKNAGENFTEEIEKIAPGVSVVLLDNSAHNAICSKTALEKAGFLENPELRGGKIYLDKNGQPTGYVSDQAVYYVLEKAIDKPLSDEKYREACVLSQNTLLRLGYTNVFDAYTNIYDPTSVNKTLKELDESGDLSINVATSYSIMSCDADNYKEKVDEVVKINEEYKSKHLNPGYIKLFADGVVESGTGWISETYKKPIDGKEHGNKVWEEEELNSIVKYANSKDLLIHAHTFGDAACKAALDSFIMSNEENKNEYRNCLGHVRNINSEDVVRAAENKIAIAANLIWHTDYDESNPNDKASKDNILSNISEDIYYSGYPMKSLMDKGVIVSNSTDAPAAMTMEGSILNVLEVATTGIAPGEDVKPFNENELLSVREGLQALTINGAWQLGLEKERGSVKVGKYADFVVLDKNILNYQGEELRTIHDTKILSTYFEGKPAYLSE